jgi:hypothetical protein
MLGATLRFGARQRAVSSRAISSLSSNPSIVSLYKSPMAFYRLQTGVADYVQESREKSQDTLYKLPKLP